MTQPFDPMDKALREALASDAMPPADLTDRIMARVAETPQTRPAPWFKRHRRWLASAAACLVIVGAALPLALQNRQETNDHAANDAAPPLVEYAADSDAPSSDELMMKSICKDDATVTLDSALSAAEELLRAQGYGLDVIARTESAVQAGLLDGSGDPVDNGGILDNAMTSAGFTCADGWYILTPEDDIP